MCKTPPVPISAVVFASSSLFVVTFDQPLIPGLISPGNWSARADLSSGVKFWNPVGQPAVAGNTVTWTGTPGAPTFGGTIITYGPPPFDLIGCNALPAPAFIDFPMSILP